MKKIKYLVFIFSFISSLYSFLNPLKDNTAKGNAFYKKGDYVKAMDYYMKAQNEDPENAKLLYNIANIYHMQKKYDLALTNYEKALYQADKELQGKIYYNKGNSFFRLKKFDESVKSYIQSLKLNPNNKQTKFNLELARKLLREHSNKQKNKKNQNSKDKKSNKKKDQKKSSQKKDSSKSNKKKDSQKNKEGKDKGQQKNKNQSQKNNQQKKGNKNNRKQSGKKTKKVKKISKKDAERILQAIADKQNKNQKYMRLKESSPRGKNDKEW